MRSAMLLRCTWGASAHHGGEGALPLPVSPGRRPRACGARSSIMSAAPRAQHGASTGAAPTSPPEVTRRRPAQAPPARPEPLAQLGTPPAAAHLDDPAHIGASGSASTSVSDFGGDVGLNHYMQLPIEQYFVLDPEKIRFLGGSRFGLRVPRVQLLGTWIEPAVEVTVRQEESSVVLVADSCRIRGSDLIERMRLDERFALTFTTRLSWTSPSSGDGSSRSSNGTSSSGSSSSGSAVGDGSHAVKPGAAHNGPPTALRGELRGDARVDVWCEVVQPFHLMPRSALEASCNVVLRGLVSSLLPMFVRQLAEDYQRWATDAEYRQLRAARTKPLMR